MLKIKDLHGAIPHFTKNGNIKLGSAMWVWSTMKGSNSEKRYVNDFNGECSGTCGKYCADCTKACYVNRSYRYGSVIKCHAINTTWIKEDPGKTFEYLDLQISRARKKPKYIRINQSGELTNNAELIRWNRLAAKYPDIKFYLYTKNYDAVQNLKDICGFHGISKNLTILISIWHAKGIKSFNKLSTLPNIKAFVYDDGILDIQPQTYCKAYNDKGKLNHDITCDKCQKCFNRNNKHKIIGCKSH